MDSYKTINKKTYDSICKFYAKDFLNNKTDNEFVDLFVSFLKPNNKVFDLGCGPGYLTKRIVSNNLNAVALDIAPKMIEIAKAYCSNAEYICSDFLETNINENAFDGVLACRSLIHFSQKDMHNVFYKLESILKNGGILGLVISVVENTYEGFEIEEYDSQLRTFFHHFSLDEIKELLRDHHFDIIFEKLEKHIDEDTKIEVKKLSMVCKLVK